MTITDQHRPTDQPSPARQSPGPAKDAGPRSRPTTGRPRPHQQQLAALPGALDVLTAARVLGIGRTMAYELVRTDQWPTPVVRVGRLVKIPTEPLVALLGATRTGRSRRRRSTPDVQSADETTTRAALVSLQGSPDVPGCREIHGQMTVK